MNALALLVELNNKNIKLIVDGKELNIRAPIGVLTPGLKKLIKKNKTEIIDILTSSEKDQKPIPRVDRNELIQLSFSQLRLWFLSQFERGNDTQYNIPWALSLTGSLNVVALENAFKLLIERHESLRTTFHSVDDQVEQVIADKLEFIIAVTDIEKTDIQLWLTTNVNHIFDLKNGPLLIIKLLRLSTTEHVLLINIHHIISDGWSMGVLTRELGVLYRAYVDHTSSPLAPLPIQYADFAYWQRQWLAGEVLEQQVAYWQEQLSGAPVLLDLPTDKPRPPVQRYCGQSIEFRLPSELVQSLHGFSREHGATLFMMLLGGFVVLLSRYSSQGDVSVGSPIANRQRQELESLIGFFVNTLVLRTRLNHETMTTTLLQQVKETTLSAYAHQDVPFEQLVAVLKPERSLSYSPLFQVMCVLQNNPDEEITLPGLSVSGVKHLGQTAKFDLTMSLAEFDGGIVGFLEYNTDLFESSTIERMAGHYQQLLQGMVECPQQRVMALELLSDSQRQHILYEWNDTAVAYPQDRCVHQLFEEQVEKTPDAMAVVFDAQQLTYRQLNSHSNQLAHYLLAEGVGPEVRVGLCVERSLDMLVGLLGILKAGGAYVPIDPQYPEQRRAFLIRDSGIGILLTQAALLQPSLDDQSVTRVCLDVQDEQRLDQSTSNPAVCVNPLNMVYVIYTSGSTGAPKGVAIAHQSVIRLVVNNHFINIHRHRCILQSASISFDAATFEVWGALLNGAKCVLYPDRVPVADTLKSIVNEHNVDALWLTAALFNALIDEDPSIVNGVNEVLVGGESLSSDHMRVASEQCPHTQFINGYGPTENTTFSAFYVILKKQDSEQLILPIGRPISNSSAYIVDAEFQPVPVNIVGELYLGGDGLSRGYLDRPELSAEKFLPHFFSHEPGERLYKSGDLARYLPDGNIEYVGRMDDQIKIRGFRIELGEIEQVLAQQSCIQDAVVKVHTREQGQTTQYVVAYVVGNETSGVDQALLRDALKAQLPEYMIPGVFIVLDTLPLTTNGKVDRNALPAPKEGDVFTQEYMAPRTQVEKTLAAIWSEVLQLPVNKIGVRDNFFELGGHSLLATRVVSQIRHVFAVDIPVRGIFTATTVQALAVLVEQTLIHSPLTDESTYPLVPIDQGDHCPLSFAQQRLWFINQFEQGGSTQYNMPWALRLSGTLNPVALEQAFIALIERHGSLRTWFHSDDDRVGQVISDEVVFSLPIIESREAHLSTQLTANVIHVFDLSEGPLLKVGLLHLLSSEHVLLINMHHIISDGWSMGVLIRELGVLYRACVDHTPSPLVPLPIQYTDFAYWQRQWLAGEVLEQQVAYWQEQLSGASALLDLPTDKPRPAVQRYRGHAIKLRLSGALVQLLHQLSREHGATLFMTLLSGFAVLLSRYSGQSDVSVGSPIANRQRQELESLIGFFVNTLVLRTRLNHETTTTTLLQQVKETALSAYAHQDVPFEQLVEVLKPERSLSYSPLFQVMCVLQNNPDEAIILPGLSISGIESAIQTAKFDLTMALAEVDGEIVGSLEYNTDLFELCTIERMVGHYQQLLQGMVECPQQCVMELELLSDSQRHHILYEWNDTAVAYPQERCVHQLFEAQVEKTPDAVAVVFDEQQLTYRQLNSRSNQLAHYLLAEGVVPEVTVGVCVERSLDMLVGLLGILKASGAYVPIDPQYPEQRKDFLLSDSGIGILLTHTALLQPSLNQSSVTRVCLDVQCEQRSSQLTSNPQVCVHPLHLVYVIYTSGSTGTPKGVGVSHDSLNQLCHWHQSTFDVTCDSKTTQLAGIGFDAMAWEIWPSLTCGACLGLVPPDRVLVPTALVAWLQQHCISHCFAPTPLAENLVLEDWPLDSPLTFMLTGGDLFKQRLPINLPFVLVNNYGPTEGTVVTTSGVMSVDDHGVSAIGRVIDNVTGYILNEVLQPVPLGVVGELYVGGKGVARGYVGRMDLTAERFIAHPFSQALGERLYKTGDLTRYLPDGCIEYAGRTDDQVKIRGFRIELGEIEKVLAEQSDVREAVVRVHTRSEGQRTQYLVAYVVSEAGSQLHQETVRDALGAQLPEYMIPSVFITLETLPLTPNGKVDRNALPAPDERDIFTQEYIAPSMEVEKALVAIWSEVLQLPANKIGVRDNFFELGGHSLLATRVVSQLRTVFAVDIPVRGIFTATTVQALVALVEQAMIHSPLMDRDTYPLVPVDQGDDCPLSFAQQRLWFINQFEQGDGIQYNMPWALRLSGNLNPVALEQAFIALIERHGSLRTCFYSEDDRVGQIINDTMVFTLPIIESHEAHLSAQLAANVTHVFDLFEGPLLTVGLLRLSATEHVLLINMHHIISDGWSMGVLTRELGILYRACLDHTPSPLAPLPIQYADFAYWQRQWLAGGVLAQQVEYWQVQLSGAPALLDLPTDKPRPAVQRYRGQSIEFHLPSALVQSLHQLSRGHDATLFMTLLGGFAVLLSRYSGQGDVSVGSPIANRQRQELELLIGFFVNTLVLRMQLSYETTTTTLLQQVKETALSAYAHQDVPFEQLVEVLKPERSLSYSPLFQVMCVLQNNPDEAITLPGLLVSGIESSIQTAKFDLTINLIEVDSEIIGFLEYNTDLFELSTIERMAGHYQQLLQSMVECPQQCVMTLALLSDSEREHILYECNDTAVAYPQERCVHQLFEEHVEKTPDAVAVVYDEQQLTYHQLDSRSNQLAQYLLAEGVGPEVKVGLCVERSLDMMVGLLGVLKAGGAYVPIDPDNPSERTAYILHDSEIAIVVTQRSVVEDNSFSGVVRCIDLDKDWAGIEQCTIDNVSVPVLIAHTAYVIYTSGSTGVPKGVAISHNNVIHYLLHSVSNYTGQVQGSVVSTPLAFDATVTSLYTSLVHGLKVHLVASNNEVESLASLLSETTMPWLFKLTPSHLMALMPLLPASIEPSFMHVFVIGGENLPSVVCDQWLDVFPNSCVVNEYGPTEATVGCVTLPVTLDSKAVAMPSASVPVGRPIGNMSAYILDAHWEVMPWGPTGELYLGGEGLACGYVGRADLTAERFIAHPFSQATGERLYKTGDLARYLSDGRIEYIGRTDDQVKIRGFRIELGEIEKVLTEQPRVQDVVVRVYTREPEQANKYLVAYVVGNDATEIDQTVLRDALKAQLPEYMIPSVFIALDKLPLTPNGKVDRNALPAPDESDVFTHEYVAPRTQVEKTLAAIWSEVLQLPVNKIGVRDNFFELGGDSILSIQVASRAHKQGLGIHTRQLFEYQTIEQLAHYVKQVKQAFEQDSSEGELTLLPIQRWFLSTHAADRQHYHQSFLLHVPEEFDAAFLREFIRSLYHRHDVLRLSFFCDEHSQWRARFMPFDRAVLGQAVMEMPLLGRTEAEREACLASEGEVIKAGFDITQGPLLNAVYFKADRQADSRLLLVIHHLVVDGVSWRVLLEDLMQAFEQHMSGQTVALSRKSSSYQHWGEQLVELSRTPLLQQEKAYWLSMVSDIPASVLDNTAAVASNTYADTDVVSMRLTRADTQALLNQCHHAYRTRINELLLSALLLAFYRWQGIRVLSLSMEGHGREALVEDIDLSGTLGWFTSVYPLRLSIQALEDDDYLVGELIKSVKEQYRAIPGNGIGYGVLRYLANDEQLQQAEQQCGGSVVFNYLGQFDQQLGQAQRFYQAQESTGADISGQLARNEILGFNGSVSEGCLQFALDYHREQFDKDSMQALGQAYQQALQAVIQHCQQPGVGSLTPSDFPLAALTQTTLDHWQEQYPALSDIYPATGMQAGLLFHNLMDGDDAYVMQIEWCMPGDLDVQAFKQAWDIIVSRHDVFRTAFVGWETDQVLQVVMASVTLSWVEEDWRGRSVDQLETDCARYRRGDKAAGLAADQAPLMRCALFRESEHRYRFLWTHHHSLFDGWCTPIVLDELLGVYQALSVGRRPALERAPKYRDYIHWLSRQDKDVAERFWQEQLKGINAPTALGIDKLPVDPGVTGAQIYEHQLDSTLTHQLLQQARRYRVTLNTLVQGAWAVVLQRYSGDKNVIFGETVSGRPADLLQSDKMVGLFINTQPVCVDVDDDQEIRTWLQKGHHLQAQRAAFSYVPLIDIQRQSEMASGGVLFTTLMVFQNYPAREAREDNSDQLMLSEFQGSTGTNYDVTLVVGPGEFLIVTLTYNAERFARETMERTVSHFSHVLQGLVDKSITWVSDLSVLTQSEREQIVYEWNDTTVVYRQEHCVHQLFEVQAEDTPDAVAVVFDEQQLTYSQLNSRSNQLAHFLLTQGIGLDVKVGLCVERSLDMVVGLLGILKAGGAYVPIDPEYPEQRITFIIDDSGIRLLLTQQVVLQSLPNQPTVDCYCLDEPRTAIWSQVTTSPVQPVTAQSLVNVIYTSGSTGKPKGVMINHGAYLNHMQWRQRAFSIAANDKVLHKTTLNFDAAGWEWILPLMMGAQLVVAKHGGQRDAEYLLTVVSDHQITLFQGVPSLVNLLVEHECKDQLQSLRYLFCGGEPLSTQLYKSYRDAGLSAQLCNLYGPTEATIDSTSWIVDGEQITRRVFIGKPMDNAQVYLLDERLDAVSVGCVGELHIGGMGLARGYLNRNDLTAEKFIADPFSAKDGSILYKSGDLARYLPDGNIEYVGRVDNQIKVRGFRVELGEIEKVLIEQPCIREAVVIVCGRAENPINEYLEAYVVGEDSLEDELAGLRDTLKTQLPEFMVPSMINVLGKMPLTANGKIDRKALSVLDGSGVFSQEYIAPRTDLEKQLVSIWAEILKIPANTISIEESFFDLGGHSLLAVRVITQVRKIIKQPVTIRGLFSHASVEAFAEFVESGVQEDSDWVDLEKEAVLDPAIKVNSAELSCSTDPQVILLTGATGFVGRFLLTELLTQTSAQVICLVRAENDIHATERLRNCLADNQLWKPAYDSRLEVIAGDLAQPLLGLSEDAFNTLAQHVEAIYHNATAMNHIATYSTLKAVTVGGTQEILRLACTYRLKTVHYSSTVNTFSNHHTQPERIRYVDEHTCIDQERHLHTSGYVASKWVAEKLILLAQQRGVPCCIYRLGLISGDTGKGRYDTDQWFYRLLTSCVQLGFFPLEYGTVTLLPVDIAVKALVVLAQPERRSDQGNEQHTVFHLKNPEPIEVSQFFEIYNEVFSDKKPLKGLPVNEWLQEIRQQFEHDEDTAGQGHSNAKSLSIYPLLMEAANARDSELKEGWDKITSVQGELTKQVLQQCGVHYPDIDRTLISCYWRFLVCSLRESISSAVDRDE